LTGSFAAIVVAANDVDFSGVLLVMGVAVAIPLLLALTPRLPVPPSVVEILAGVVIGPALLGLVEPSDEVIRVMAKHGVAFLLFLAGLELDFRRATRQPPEGAAQEHSGQGFTLRRRWPDLVFIESAFGRLLVADETTLLTRLRQVRNQVGAMQPSGDRRLALTDEEAVSEVVRQIELLTPWARRVRKAGREGPKA
jgi:hypothetical protein